VEKNKSPTDAPSKLKSPRVRKKTASTPHLDGWFEQTLKQRAEVEEWGRQNNLPRKKPVDSVSDLKGGQVHHSDPQKLFVAGRKSAGSAAASIDVTAKDRLDELLEMLWADVHLWQSIHDEDSPSEISLYISQKHGLRFPAIPLTWSLATRNLTETRRSGAPAFGGRTHAWTRRSWRKAVFLTMKGSSLTATLAGR
jgi:hypothetical protein